MLNNKYHFVYGEFTITIERETDDVWNYVIDNDRTMRMIDAGYGFLTYTQAEMAAKKFIDKNFPLLPE